MLKYDLSRDDMARVLQTPVRTQDDWLSETRPRMPPACMLTLMTILEQSPQARRLAGVHRKVEAAPRGKPFRKGNPHRFAKAKGASAAPGNSRKVD